MRKLYWFVRLSFKRLVQRLHLCAIFGMIEYCHVCGRKQPLVWWAEDADWEKFSQGKGITCPECFDQEAAKQHVVIRWIPTIEV